MLGGGIPHKIDGSFERILVTPKGTNFVGNLMALFNGQGYFAERRMQNAE